MTLLLGVLIGYAFGGFVGTLLGWVLRGRWIERRRDQAVAVERQAAAARLRRNLGGHHAMASPVLLAAPMTTADQVAAWLLAVLLLAAAGMWLVPWIREVLRARRLIDTAVQVERGPATARAAQEAGLRHDPCTDPMTHPHDCPCADCRWQREIELDEPAGGRDA